MVRCNIRDANCMHNKIVYLRLTEMDNTYEISPMQYNIIQYNLACCIAVVRENLQMRNIKYFTCRILRI